MKQFFILVILYSSVLLSMKGQESASDILLLEAKVLENRIQTPLSLKAASVTVISKKDLAELPGLSVADKLHNVNGLDLRSRGPHGVQTDVGLRGSTFDQVLVLINGIKLNDAQTGHHILNLPIDLESIDRIEIHFGSTARVFGQNAFAGAINIITSLAQDDFIKISVGAGDFDLKTYGLSVNIATPKIKQYISADYNSSRGYKYNTDYEIANMFYESEFNIKGHKLKPIFGYSKRKFGANGFYASPDFKDQYEEVTTSIAALSYSPRLKLPNSMVNVRAYWRRNHDYYEFVRNKPEIYNNIHTNHQYGIEVNSTFTTEAGILGLGLDVQLVDLKSTNLGARKRSVVSAFIEHKFSLLNSRLSITPGVQLNDFSDFGIKFLPGVDAAFFINDFSKVYFNSGQTYRIPTYTDLYYSDPANSSNPNLLPEFANSQEIGYSNKLNSDFSGDVAIFRRRSNNLIDRVKVNEESRWTPENISDLTHTGASMNINFSPEENKLIRLISVGYTYLNSTIDLQEGVTSRFSLENLRHQISTNAVLNYGTKLSHSLTYRYADRINLDAYGLLDSRISLKHKEKLNIFIDITNILNTNYQETNLVIMPGRWASFGVSFKFISK